MIRAAGTIHKAPGPARWAIGLCALAALVCSPRPGAGQAAGDPTSAQVSAAVQRGVAYLRQTQRGDGSWPDSGGHRGGGIALALLALLNAGAPGNDPAVIAGMDALDRIEDQHTYVVSLKCQVYGILDDPKYKARLQASTDWLVRSQTPTGMWSYGYVGPRAIGRGDNSNTQFALLGLHEAAKAGAKVPQAVWERSRQHFANTQTQDGGWDYRAIGDGRGRSYGSMTVAGVASLYVAGHRLHVGGPRVFANGAYPDCGRYRQDVVLAAGLKWIADNFSVQENPNRGRTWLHYYLYGLERVGMLSGLRNFGPHDWYREGAAHLVETQDRNGTWGGQIHDTVFGLLFLAKGNRPVLVQKLKWRSPREPSWNRNIHDLENLTAFIDDKFGKRVTWQTTTLELPLAELRISPVLFITGHEFPVLDEQEKRKLRDFVQTGGTILAEACCGSKDYAAGFRRFAAEVFPEYRLGPLEKTHPVFRSFFQVDDLYDLEGIDVGCRTGVFFSPRALSCLWELQTIARWSNLAFQIGTNICAYATGKELLRDKLDVVELPRPQESRAVEAPRGAIRIARLIHDGDYRADIHAEENLAAMLRDQARVDVVARGRHLQATDDKLFDYPVLFMTGHYSFELPDRDLAALRLYLDRGGFLLAEACCGRAAFDKSFRQMVARLLPAQPLEALPADHPIYTGRAGVALGELRYRKILADELNSRGTTQPPLEAVVIQGRTVILYSKHDFSCALEGDSPYSCRGYVDAGGKKLALNVFLYAISY